MSGANFLDEIKWRGLYHEGTPGVADLLAEGPQAAYIGFDPTADSLHLGGLSTLMLLAHFQRAGHKPIVVIGGATGMIGDPSGKSKERNLLGRDEIEQNIVGMRRQMLNFLDFDPGATQAEILNNYYWMQHFTFLDFLRQVGKNLTINYMLAKDSVQNRLETGLSFTEFTYQLLQAYDFYYLYRNKKCKLQMGGSDQWGNITSGIELIRRVEGASAQGLVGPLMLKADGTKFGKSEEGNIWLDPEKTSPYKFYQYLMNVADEDLPALLRRFSFRSHEEIEQLVIDSAAKPEARIGQQAIAEELTERVHGKVALERAQNATAVLFGKDATEELKQLSSGEFLEIFEGVPQQTLNKDLLNEFINIVDLLVESGASGSKSEARRSLKEGAVRVNKARVQSADEQFEEKDLLNEAYLLLQVGKKKYYIARFE